MNLFRSVGAQLALALALVVAIALAIVYAIVVPRLERNLVAAKIDALRQASEPIASTFDIAILGTPDLRLDVGERLSDISSRTNSRVVIYDPLTLDSLSVIADSRQQRTSTDVQDDPIALQAASTVSAAEGTVTRNDERYAEVAFPLYTSSGTVILFSSSLRDTLANVELVQRRVLLAAVPALIVAALLGYGLASVFARRIRRLERAADRIAGGRFDEPVVVSGRDELAQLATAFERMRGRLSQLERARREFIANASHELRTPIFSLGGFVELMANEELDEDTRREFLATMQEQVARLQKLATDLLDLSRLDAGQLLVEREPLALAQLAEAVVEEFAVVAQATGHRIEVDGDAEALGDELRVLQIARILVENAIRHTPPGTSVRVVLGSDAGRASLTVEDEGGGIAPAEADQVFERFYRIEGNRASGSGLGLAIARQLASLMDGALVLELEPGRTRFRLVLPAAAPAREPALV
jgi:two-component system OmpR family sensor kinase